MIESCKTQKQNTPQFVECDNCAMQAICQPLSTDNQTLDLTSHYLNRHVPAIATKQSAQQVQTKNDVIFEQNKQLTTIFSVCSGVFKLYKNNTDGSQKVVGFRFPGELMAEDAIFLEKYNYSAIAIGESSVCEVSIEQFNACGKLAPELQQNLIKLLTKQSFEQQRNTQALIGQKSSDSLLAAFLLNICQRNAKYMQSETEMDMVINRGDIANFLGIRRETLSRLLKKFQQEKFILLKGKKLQLLSPESLQKLINN